MKLLLAFAGLCFGLNLFAQETTVTNGVTPPRFAYRYLIIIDTSSSMSHQKDVTMDTVNKLILSGFGGRIHAGDTFGIWTFDEQLRTNAFAAVMWDPRQGIDYANRAYRFLRDATFKNKASLKEPLAAMTEEAEFSGMLTTLLFTSGAEPVKGTPFDAQINDIFEQHAREMKKVKKPFVVVLVAQNGKLVGQAVSPGGGTIYIPPLPKAVSQQAGSEPKKTPPPVQEKPPRPKKTLTVTEITEQLRQTQIQKAGTNSVASAPPPVTSTSEKSTATQAQVEQIKPAPIIAQPARSPPTPVSNPPDQTALHTPPTAPEVKPASPPPSITATQTSGPIQQPPIETTKPGVISQPQQSNSLINHETVPSQIGELHLPAATTAQTGVLLPGESGSHSSKYLLAAVALLLTALLLAWLYIRSIRYVPRPSIISQSLDKEKK